METVLFLHLPLSELMEFLLVDGNFMSSLLHLKAFKGLDALIQKSESRERAFQGWGDTVATCSLCGLTSKWKQSLDKANEIRLRLRSKALMAAETLE